MNFIGGIIFPDLGVRHVASHKLFFMKINMFVFLWTILSWFFFFELKKTPKVIWRLMVHTRARELPLLMMWTILDNIAPKQPTLQCIIGGELETLVDDIG